MKSARRVKQALGLFGIDVDKASQTLLGIPRYVKSARAYQVAAAGDRFSLRPGLHFPMMSDADDTAGGASGDYFQQDLWAARRIFARRPERHVDIGSRIDGFVSHLLVFMPVEVIDVRPLKTDVAGLSFTQEDATTLARFPSNSIGSLSSLHAVEHFGLGRYGDPINPASWRQAMLSMARVLRPGGHLYFSVPIGRERVVFNAHRIFAISTVLHVFSELDLVSFSIVNRAGQLLSDVSPHSAAQESASCGLFEFTKR